MSRKIFFVISILVVFRFGAQCLRAASSAAPAEVVEEAEAPAVRLLAKTAVMVMVREMVLEMVRVMAQLKKWQKMAAESRG